MQKQLHYSFGFALAIYTTVFTSTVVAQEITPLSDHPLFVTSQVPGNLALALSVEYPTVTRLAHTEGYDNEKEFLGYFDPQKCYTYAYNSSKQQESYFQPAGLAVNRQCSGQWSGNFLNWATSSTIDPFRWALTGGRRVVDTLDTTIIEKANHTGQGNLFPDRNLPASFLEGATPFKIANNSGGIKITMNNKQFNMEISPINYQSDPSKSFKVEYFNNTTGNFSGTPVHTETRYAPKIQWSGSPGSGVNADFSSRWTGSFSNIPSGTYQFRIKYDDTAKLYINNTKVAEGSSWLSWDNDSAWTAATQTSTPSNGKFDIKIEHTDTGGGASVWLQWRKCTTSSCSTSNNNNWGAWEDFNSGNADSKGYYNGDTILSNTSLAVVRVKVCDPSDTAGGVEANCVRYQGNTWKPEGLIQEYADYMRYSAFGYLNDDAVTRDAGVLRARQKFVGPYQPRPGQATIANPLKEWDGETGIMVRNPDAEDAAKTSTEAGLNGNDTIQDSGVINYLNGFGQIITGNYKSIDPVNELYYAALRYYRGLDNIPAWSNLSHGDLNNKKKWLDGFPIITDWKKEDPIQYYCQKNFVLGIGDTNTHRDRNVPGTNTPDAEGSVLPNFGEDSSFFNAHKSTGQVKKLQGMSGAADQNSGSSGSNHYMAGLAFEANTKDLRPNMQGKQTVQTYWVDVLESGFSKNNKFYLASKFGGLDNTKLPNTDNFDPYTYEGLIDKKWWSTNGETVGDQDRPNNYFTAGRPDTMVAGLREAFERITNAIRSYTTSLSFASPYIESGNMSFSASFDSTDWTGAVKARKITYYSTDDLDNEDLNLSTEDYEQATLTEKWTTHDTLTQQVAGKGWDTNRKVISYQTTSGGYGQGIAFRYNQLSSGQQSALNTSYVPGNDAEQYLAYLRGDKTHERGSEAADSQQVYRSRTVALGDIVNSKLLAIAGPADNLRNIPNPGYGKFVSDYKDRLKMLYVGANDGMLHAFAAKTGQEVFAYIPNALFSPASGLADSLLGNIGNPNYEHRYTVNASPLAFDVDFANTHGAIPGQDPDWHTILVGGLGKGGRSYYAIDITDSDALQSSNEAGIASKVLWETNFSDMGYSFGEPLAFKTKKYGWVVALSSGYNTPGSKGFISLIHPKTGERLEKIETSGTSTGLVAASAYYADLGDKTAESIYVADLDGQLWRFDLTATTGNYPMGDKIAQLNDTNGDALPITTPPLVLIGQQARERLIVIGTGRLLSDFDVNSPQQQTLFVIKDGFSSKFVPFAPGKPPIVRQDLKAVTDLQQGIVLQEGESMKSLKGWYFDLDIDADTGKGWRIISKITASSGKIAFPASIHSDDPCHPSGNSRVYSIGLENAKTAWQGTDNESPPIYIETNEIIEDLYFIQRGKNISLLMGGAEFSSITIMKDLIPKKDNPISVLNWREVLTFD